MNKNTKSMIKNMALFIGLICFTLWMILKEQSINEIVDVFKSLKYQYMVIGLGFMVVFLLLEGINIRRTLKNLDKKITVKQSFRYALIGFFFSAITPAASGGQPMQIFYMNKDGISAGKSTLALLINLMCMQIVTISMAFISVFVNNRIMNKALTALFSIGISLNLLALLLLLISIFSRRLSRGLVKFSLKILKIFKAKNYTQKRKKIAKELRKYHESSKYIKGNKKLIFKNLLTTYIQFIFYYAISYCVYLALGFTQSNVFEMITMQSLLFATVSGIPSPGAVGVSEGAFIEIYRMVYPVSLIRSATIALRFLNFYLFVFISGIVIIANNLKSKKKI